MATNYAYALTYVDFDIDNKDVMYFKNDSEKDTYFNLSSLFSGELKYINFEKKNLLNVTFTIDSSNDNVISNEYQYNYLIIKEISTGAYYFYFIISTNYDNKAHLRVTCKMDTFTTYRNLVMPRGVIKRATFREFEKDSTDTYAIYDRGAYTHILTIDDSYKGEKFIQAQKTIYPHIYTYTQSVLDTWFEENIEAWQYVFLDRNHKMNVIYDGTNNAYRKVENFLSHGINNDYGILVFPIYKTSGRIVLRCRDVTDGDNPINYILNISQSSLDNFRNANNDSTYIYNMKISKQAPFNVIDSASSIMQLNCSVSVSGGNLILDFGDVTSLATLWFNSYTHTFFTMFSTATPTYKTGTFMFEFVGQTNKKYTCDLSSFIDDYINTKMLITTYKNSTKAIDKYPNVICNKNLEVRITYNGEIFSIHPSRLDTSQAILEIQEAIAPDISKIYVNWKPTNKYIDKNAMADTLTGFIFNDDTSIPIGNDYMAQFLANNKNFYMQRYINTAINSGTKGAKAYASGGVGGLALSVINSGLDVANLLWEEDNLENRASSLKMANGSALFNNLVKDYGCKCEIWMMTKEELTNICEYYNKFGVGSTQNGYLLDVLEKHKYFDYVEMDVTDIIMLGINGISNEIKQDIINKLKRGVRFWYDKDKMYNYEFYNYEVAFDS